MYSAQFIVQEPDLKISASFLFN